MADPNKGTDTTDNFDCNSEWLLVDEAECVDDLDVLDELLEESTQCSTVSNLIDDDPVDIEDQGNSLALFNSQVTEDCNTAISALKRKLIKSPQLQTVAELSPRLQAVSISPKKQSKRRLFDDSGIGEDEAQNTSQVALDSLESSLETSGAGLTINLLHCSNRQATVHLKFKELYGVSFKELTRNFKSDKSCSNSWVIAVYNAVEEVLEASKVQLQKHVEFLQLIVYGFHGLYLIVFKSTKNRDTVSKLFTEMLNVNALQLMCDPPRTRSVPVALFFYRKSLGNASFMYGEVPDWIKKQTLVEHQSASAAETFDFSSMVQWAYDNEFTEEAEIAYQYALAADEDPNAEAFLKHNNQYKFVKDCAAMVKMYRRYELRQMSMAEWIDKCCSKCTENGNWKIIATFLKHQNVQFLSFLIALKPFLQGVPKKNCLVFVGPPDTGKSYFCFTLIRFFGGKVVSFMNRNSHFWLQPLQDTKLGFLDDATHPCWVYMDINLRNGLDGNLVSLDAKHRAPMQMKLPPLLVTTNVDVMEDQSLRYLHSRLVCFKFPNKLPLNDDGSLVYEITNDTWACFFRKFATQLNLVLEDGENGNTGNSDRTFRCTARCHIESN